MVVQQEMAEIHPPDAEELSLFLPDTDCGDCGFGSCIAFAEAMIDEGISPRQCSELTNETAQAMVVIAGLDKSPIPYNIMMEQSPCDPIGVNNPDKGSPILVTCNFQETVRIMRSILESMGVRCWLLPTFTHGYSVDNAVHERMFKATEIWKALKEGRAEEMTDNRLLIIPGLAESEKSAIGRLTGWDVRVGPVSGFLTSLFLLELQD